MKKILLSVIVGTMTAFTANAQWQPVGTAGFTPAGVGYPSIAFNSNDELYVAFKDGASAQKATVMRFDGTDWVTVGTAGFSSHFATRPIIAINSNNEPYVAYRDDVYATDNKLTVKKYDGTDWVTVGAAEFSGYAAPDNISLAFNSNDELYVAYREDNSVDIVNKATVMKFDGTNWVTVGAAGFSSASNISLAFNSNNEPFVAFRNGQISNKATVMKFDGTDWVTVGTAGFSAAGSEYTSLAFNSSDEPYVAYRDAGNSQKTTVMKFDGTDWVTVGTAGFSEGVASYTSLAFNSSNEPYVAFREFVSGSIQNQATVMKFDGTDWVTVGNQGFSYGYADQTRLAFNSIDEPHVVYTDVTQLYKATVMKFGNGTMSIEEQLNKSFSIYPNPADDMLYFSELLKNIEIYSINGQKLMHYSDITQLNIDFLDSGTYLFQAETADGKTTVQKIIKK